MRTGSAAAAVLLAVVAAAGIAVVARARTTPSATDATPGTMAAESALGGEALLQARPASGIDATPAKELAGLDLVKLGVDDDGATAPLPGGRVARLTLDPDLQRTAQALLDTHHIPEGAIVALDVSTFQVLAYASHLESAPPRDLCVASAPPAASVFKVVTGAALVEHAGLGPGTRQCYSGGEQRIHPSDLVDDPRRDRWCVTLAGAMGRSVNAVFARLAQRHLTAPVLDAEARAFGFGEPLPFDVPVEASKVEIPTEPLGFARTAAGFWNTSLSPLEAAYMSATIARGGESLRPAIVKDVFAPGKQPTYVAPTPAPVIRRAVSRETAQAVTAMMEHTVSEGTSYKAFHDPAGTPFLPGVPVAGKTGTLSETPKVGEARLVTWFTGFAPSRPAAGGKQIAVAVLVVNKPTWTVKANVIARELLRAYFAAQNVQGVSRPALTAVAHKGSAKGHARPRASR